MRSALLLYNKMLNRCAIEFFVKHIQCSFLLFSIHFEARQFGTLEIFRRRKQRSIPRCPPLRGTAFLSFLF